MARQGVDHYIPLFGRDFYASTATWTAEEVGHYIRLMIIQWESGGLPADPQRLELVSPGLARVWQLLETKFPVWEDGLRRNHRLEEHRERAAELKEARAEAGRSGGLARQANGKQTPKQNSSKTQANGQANTQAKTKPPSPSPSPSSNASPAPSPNVQHTHAGDGSGCENGWEAEAWGQFLEAWGTTPNAAAWQSPSPPSTWAAYASDPGWLSRAYQAMDMLPACQFFEHPVAVTKFFEWVDRILAHEFDEPKPSGRKPRQLTGGNL